VFLSVDATPEEMQQLADKLKSITGYDFIVVPSKMSVLDKEQVVDIIRQIVKAVMGDLEIGEITDMDRLELQLKKRAVEALESIAKSLRHK